MILTATHEAFEVFQKPSHLVTRLALKTLLAHKNPVSYRLLIFDFDGTLADSFPVFLEHMAQMIEHFGLRPIEPQSLDQLRTRSARELISDFGIPAWKVPLVVRYMRRLMAAHTSRTPLFARVPEMLQRLSENITLAVVSSNSEANIRAILGPENSKRIRAYACGASLFGKAAKFRRVLKRTGVPAYETLAIGDEIRDLESAREAGIAFGAVSWGYTHVDAFRNYSPAFVFRHPDEILELH